MRERKKVKSNDQAKYNRLRKVIEMDCRRAKDETLQSRHRTREMHEKIKVTGQEHKQTGSNCIKDKNGNMLFDESEMKKIWEKYVTTLYNDTRANPPDLMNEEGEEIMLPEVEKAIEDLRDKKAPGKDDITVEMIKALDHCTIPIVHRLVNNIYKSGYIPKEMNESIIVTLPKSQRPQCAQNIGP